MVDKIRVKRLAPFAGSVTTANETGRRVEIMTPRVAASGKFRRRGSVACSFCRIGYSCVGNGIFHVVGQSLVDSLHWSVAEPSAFAEAACGVVGRCEHRFHGTRRIDTRCALHNGIGHRYYARIAHHAIILTAPEMPHRQMPLFFIKVDHGVDYLGAALTVDDRQQRQMSAIGVPQRQDRIGRSGAIVIERGRQYHHMIHGRIELAQLCGVVALHSHTRKLPVPDAVGFGRHAVEVLPVGFDPQIGYRGLDGCGRYTHPDCHLRSLLHRSE